MAVVPVITVPQPKPLDYERIADCILMVEGNRWHHPGGAFGFQRDAWAEDAGGLLYLKACDPRPARWVAIRRLQRFATWLRDNSHEVTVRRLASAWRHTKYLRHTLQDAPDIVADNYGERVENLYEDATFKP